MQLPIEKRALDILKTYKGSNDYILGIQNTYFTSKSFIPTKNQSDYIIRNGNVDPVVVNKLFDISKSCRSFIAEQLKLDFIPENIFINKLLSRKENFLHVYGCFEEGCDEYHTFYISKECVKVNRPEPEIDPTKYERDPKPHQITAIKKLLTNDKFILADEMGLGKMEYVDNELFTPYGRKRIGDVIVGDKVIGSDGKPYNVMGVYPQGNKELYRVTFNDGYSILVGGEHLWSVSSSNSGENSKNRVNRYITLSTNQMLDKDLTLEQKGYGWNEKREYKFTTYYKKKDGSLKWQIPIVKPIEFSNNHVLPIDPYLMGVILGDGHNREKSISFTFHKDDFDEILTDVSFNEIKSTRPNVRLCNLYLKNELIDLGLNNKKSYEKFIPDIYKYTSIENRLAILQGLMDTDGHCMKSKSKKSCFQGTEYATVSEQLADDIAEIVQSLGGIVRKKSKIGSYTKDGVKHICRVCYRLNIKMPEGINPFRLKRKANLYNIPAKYKVGRYIKNIEPCGSGEAVCISVDAPDKLYVTEHAIVTHNTTSAIIAAMEGQFKKILVVCPASLKLNWKIEISNYDSPDNISVVDGSNLTVNKWTIMNYDILKNFHHLPRRGVKTADLPVSPIDYHKFDLVIADEAHYLKNAASNRTKIFNDFAMKIPVRWLLTGTPITNKPIDFYNLLYLCESPVASNWVGYVKRYCAGRQFNRKGTKQKYWVCSGSSNLEELKDFSADVILRRTKSDSIDLPQKTIKPVYLPLEFSTSYNAYIDEYEAWIEEMEAAGEKPTITDHLTKLIKVRQLLSYDKIVHTIEMAEEIIENGQKVIIFSCFSNTIKELMAHFGKKAVMIDGSVSKEKRQQAVESFQNDEKITVFCGNIVAAGVGLTLTEGSVVIFNDLDWTPANHMQAEDRAHRIGQQNQVHIIYPLFADTLDMVMYKALQSKMKIISTIMGDNPSEEQISVGKEVIMHLRR